jgi:hypothetical protein
MIKVLAEPAVKSRILDAGFSAGLPRTPAQMQAGLQADYKRVGTVLDSIGFKPE